VVKLPRDDRRFFNAIMDTAVGVLQDETMMTVSHLEIVPRG
jgi:hypothetical protein